MLRHGVGIYQERRVFNISQPVDLGQYIRVSGTAAGTTVVRNRGAGVLRVIVPTTKTGTVDLYDTNVTTGTTAANFIMSIQNTGGSVPTSAALGFNTQFGLTVVKGGTTDLVLVVE